MFFNHCLQIKSQKMSYVSSVLILFLIILNVCNVKTTSTIEKKCQNGENKIFVLDALTTEERETLKKLSTSIRPWILNERDVFKQGLLDMKLNATWLAPVDIVERTIFWRRISGILQEVIGSEQYLCYATFTLVYRMDFIPMSRQGKNDLTVVAFLNEDMNKNSYGELVFYDKDEVICGVHQKPGRAVIWNSSIAFISKPPSMNFNQAEISLVLQLVHNTEEYKQCSHINEMKKEALSKRKPQTFPFINNKRSSIQSKEMNIAKYLKNKYHDSHGREIAVFDDILSQSELNELQEYLTNDYNTFGFHAYDNNDETHDNVAWISMQQADVLVKSGLWQIIKNVAVYLSGWDQWYPYDVSMNIIHSFHHTRIHEDCEDDEYEYTFLLYLNKEWNENLYGETVFFENTNGSQDEEYEIIAAVKPRYGRIVMFQGIIPHSARPPSPDFHQARYTFACKVSKTYGTAKMKKLRETLQDLGLEDEDLPQFENGKQQSDEIVNLELMRQKKILSDYLKTQQSHVINRLCDKTK